MNVKGRCEVVRAMETIARCIEDEDVFMGWLMTGVADGDITENTTDEDLECYIEDKTFRELMESFMRRMRGALESGGIGFDRITTRDSEV